MQLRVAVHWKEILTLCASIFSCDALHGTYDLLGDRRRHGRGVYCTMRMATQVVHQILQCKTPVIQISTQIMYMICCQFILVI